MFVRACATCGYTYFNADNKFISLRTWFLQFLSPDGLHAKNVSLFVVCLLVLYGIAKVTRIAVAVCVISNK